MTSKKQDEVPKEISGPTEITAVRDGKQLSLHKGSTALTRLEQVAMLPHRNALLHWAAFVLSLLSLVPAIMWAANPQMTVPRSWLGLDLALSVFFVFEFVTRSGFRWHPRTYVRTRFFDFIAIVPVLLLVYFGAAWETGWIWLILVARAARALDRILGDGFVRRNAFALLEGFEEEITDRVMIRIINRIEGDLGSGKFGQVLADSLVRNKQSVLRRIRSQHPQRGLVAGLARISGLELALDRLEEGTYDSVIEVLASPEVDRAIHESLESTFSVLKTEIGTKTWKQHLGIQFKLWK
jgi:hypothetical protein